MTPPTISTEAQVAALVIKSHIESTYPERPFDTGDIETYVQTAINTSTEALAKENQRLFDLVRYQRADLHEAGLINDKEYADLATEQDGKMKGSVARLESYDQLAKDNAELREENLELNQLFEMQHKRMIEAIKVWRGDDPTKSNRLPDLGALLEWFITERDTLTARLATMEKTLAARGVHRFDCPAVDPDWTPQSWRIGIDETICTCELGQALTPPTPTKE